MTVVATTMIPEPDLLEPVHPTDRITADGRPTSRVPRAAAAHPEPRNALAVVALYAQTIAIVVVAVHFETGGSGQLARLDRRVRAHGPRPRPVRGADARSRAPAACSATASQRLRRALAARLPVVHADRRVPARPHGAPPRGVRPRRARHPALPRLPDLEATRCAASSCATRRAAPAGSSSRACCGAVRSDSPPVRFQARAIVACAAGAHRDRHRAAPPVGVFHPVARAVSHRVARHQPAPLDRRARRNAAFEGPPPDDAQRCASRRRRASSSCRSTSAGTSPTTSTPASRWRTCPKLHAELRRAGYVVDGLEYRSYTVALAQAVERCKPPAT